MNFLKVKVFYALTALLSLTLTTPYVIAQEDGGNALYDPVAPANSSFIRVLNLTDGVTDFNLSGKTSSQTISAMDFGGYLFVESGEVSATVGSQTYTATLQEKDVVTLVYKGDSIEVITDSFFDSRRKSRASFYNLADKPLTLATSDGSIPLFENLGGNSRGERELNEVKILLSTFDADNKIGDFEELLFMKGRSYSLVVTGNEGSYVLLMEADFIDPIL